MGEAYGAMLKRLRIDGEERFAGLDRRGPAAAAKVGDELLARWAKGAFNAPRNGHCMAVFLVLARGKKGIAPRFDGLLPLPVEGEDAVFEECFAALPEERRLAAARRAITRARGTAAVEAGLRLLARVPDVEIARAVMTASKECEIAPYTTARVRPKVEKLARKHPALLAAIGKAPTPLEVLGTRRPRTPSELSAAEKAQLLAAAKKYDGRKVPIEERFGPDDGSETSFGTTIELTTLGEEGKPRYDVVAFAGDSGSVFVHGKTREVAAIVQGSIETKSGELRERLAGALAGASKKKAPRRGGSDRFKSSSPFARA